MSSTLLCTADPVRPFDFLVDGELLRLSLAKYLQAKQISTVSSTAQAATDRLLNACPDKKSRAWNKGAPVELQPLMLCWLQEAVLEVEYVPAVLPPTPKEEHPHDDW